MNWLKIIILMPIFVLCCGCTPTIKVQEGLNSNFVNRKFDDFVIQYGPPSSKYIMDDGSIMYSWNSDVAYLTMPAKYAVNAVGNNGLVVDQTGGGTIYMECGLRILVSGNKVIRNIIITKDTIGIWNSSRCSEVFSGMAVK